MSIQGLHVISTGKQSPDELIAIAGTIYPYIDYIHLREKTWTEDAFRTAIDALLKAGVPRDKIIMNTHAQIADAKTVGGVQLTHQSISAAQARRWYGRLRIGCSVHSVKEAANAAEDGADYVTYGHIFESGSKPGVEPRGLAGLREVVQQTSIPVVAIGGITPDNTKEVLESGAAGIAVLSGILLAEDPLAAVQRYRQSLEESRSVTHHRNE
ncbi:thiazole tautomerase TenI [Lentibacillus lipolyticus]|nr:thiazole tautomerase TenI [Lentibacillus lipolyticus]